MLNYGWRSAISMNYKPKISVYRSNLRNVVSLRTPKIEIFIFHIFLCKLRKFKAFVWKTKSTISSRFSANLYPSNLIGKIFARLLYFEFDRRKVNLPQNIAHQTPDFSHTFTVNCAVLPPPPPPHPTSWRPKPWKLRTIYSMSFVIVRSCVLVCPPGA